MAAAAPNSTLYVLGWPIKCAGKYQLSRHSDFEGAGIGGCGLPRSLFFNENIKFSVAEPIQGRPVKHAMLRWLAFFLLWLVCMLSCDHKRRLA